METSQLITIADWKAFAESKLPPPEYVIQRNKKITCAYARLYHSHPALLKWAGMASFASHKVGLALKPFELYLDDNGCIGCETECLKKGLDVMDDLNVIRYTNNKVYEDIGWVHFAYVSPLGGIGVLKKQLEGLTEHALLLEGFIEIEKGKNLLEAGDKTAAESHIWRGNSLLLKHEQQYTVQPMFSKLDFAFRKFLALATAMDFDAKHFRKDSMTYTSFYSYMWLKGLKLLWKTRSFPSIVHFEHRWTWIEQRMLNIWKKVDGSDTAIREKISSLMTEETENNAKVEMQNAELR